MCVLLSGTLDFHPTNTVVMCVLARACCVIHKQIVLVKVLENGLCLCLTYHTFYSSQLSFGARKKKNSSFIQLVLWASSSYVMLGRGFFLLVLIISELTQQDWRGKKTANLVGQAWQ